MASESLGIGLQTDLVTDIRCEECNHSFESQAKDFNSLLQLNHILISGVSDACIVKWQNWLFPPKFSVYSSLPTGPWWTNQPK